MKSKQRILACGLFTLFAASCGGGDDDDNTGGGGAIATGLPRANKISSLSDAESRQACSKTLTALNNLLTMPELERFACDGLAVESIVDDSGGNVDASDIPMCKEISNKCQSSDQLDEADLNLELADASACANTTTAKMFGKCEATVAEYESCMGRVAKELRARFLSLTCDVLKDISKIDETLNGDLDVSDAPECQAVKTKCPDVELVIEAGTDG